MTAPLVTGDNMDILVSELEDLNAQALRQTAVHIQAAYVEPRLYQAALGELSLMLLEMRRKIAGVAEIVDKGNGKKQRYRSDGRE